MICLCLIDVFQQAPKILNTSCSLKARLYSSFEIGKFFNSVHVRKEILN